MKRPLLLGLAVALCACEQDTFDDRYSRSENAIEQRALELDKQLDNADSPAPETDRQAEPN